MKAIENFKKKYAKKYGYIPSNDEILSLYY